jgi:SAM-dependent methyltransferase
MERSYGPVANENQVREYERRRYRSIDQRLMSHLEWRTVARLLDRAGVGGATILDVPCGYGRFTGRLAERGGLPLVADVSVHMVARTRRGLSPAVPGAAVDVLALPFADASVDGALVMRLLHHLPDSERRQALGEVARVIRKWAVFSAYTVAPLHRLMRRIQGRPPKEASPSVLGEQVASAGLEIVESRAVLPYLHAQRIFLVRPKRGSAGAGPGHDGASDRH